MGTFGLGGLHRKSTWLYPVPTFASLPPTAVDGSAVVIQDTDQIWEFDGSTNTWLKMAPTSGGATPQHVDFTPALNQTVFLLPSSPTDPTDVLMEVNHVTYYPPISFTVGGAGNQTVTWLNAFKLDPFDSVRIYF